MASCIWKAQGLFLDWCRLIMQNVISLHTEKPAQRGFQHMRGHLPTHWRNTGGGVPRPDACELLKTPSHRLVRSQYCGMGERRRILAGSWDMCEAVSGGGGNLLPPPRNVGWGRRPLALPPPVPTRKYFLWFILSSRFRLSSCLCLLHVFRVNKIGSRLLHNICIPSHRPWRLGGTRNTRFYVFLLVRMLA